MSMVSTLLSIRYTSTESLRFGNNECYYHAAIFCVNSNYVTTPRIVA